MRRRDLFFPLAWVLAAGAQSRAEILEIIAPLASALSDGDPGLFMKHINPSMPGYLTLRENVYALARQFLATSSIQMIRHDGGEAELDWYMQIRSRETDFVVDRRREVVTVRLGKDRKIRSIGPIEFFAPPKVR